MSNMRRFDLWNALIFLTTAAVLVVVVNLLAMFRGTMQIVRDPGPGQLLPKSSSLPQSSEVVSSAE